MRGKADNDDARTLEDELLELLASQARKVLVPVFIVSAMIASFAAPYIDRRQWIGWLVAVFCILLARAIVIPLLKRSDQLSRFRRLSIIIGLSLAHGVIQAYSLTFFPDMEILQQSMQSMLLAGLCMGAVSTSGGYLPFFLAFVLPIMVPLVILWLYSVGGSGQTELDLAVAIATFLFISVLVSVSSDTYKQFKASFDDRRKLREAIDSKTRFLATASHDLRQPMQAISASIESLDSLELDPDKRAIIQDLNIAEEDLSQLLHALLDISRLDAGVEDLEQKDFNLYRLLFAIVDEFEPGAREKDLDISLECPTDAFARTNPMQLKRIVGNLVENAVRYTDQGSVRIRCTSAGNAYMIDVIDTGIGIEKSALPSIFEDFRQLGDHGRSQKRTGLGLGLSIVRRLIDQLGLDLNIQSDPGVGSTFSITVPRGKADHPVELRPLATQFQFDGLEVLVIDDEEDVARAIQKMLVSIGCSVRIAGGVDSAMQLINEHPPQVLLVDRRLRGDEDGLELIESVRKSHGGMPAVLISGDTAPDRIREAENAGIPALVKPAGLDEIKRSIALACS